MLLGILAAWPRWRWSPARHDRLFAACVCAVAAMAASRAFSAAGVLERPMLTQPEALVVLATVTLLAFTLSPMYGNPVKRRPAVAVYRLLVCWLLPPCSGQAAAQLSRPPAGAVVDMAGVLIGAGGAWVTPYGPSGCNTQAWRQRSTTTPMRLLSVLAAWHATSPGQGLPRWRRAGAPPAHRLPAACTAACR